MPVKTDTCFRYPGAKNKMLPDIMEYLNPILENQKQFTDVFVGGGSVTLEVAKQYPDIELFINDRDCWMYSFWKILCDKDDNQFNQLLELVDNKPTLELFYALREEKTADMLRCAYKAIFFNRCTFSGIFKSGPIGGKDQKSKYTVDCRYNAIKIKSKMLNMRNLLKDRTIVSNDDFANYESLIDNDMPAYLDPPYVKAGPAIYTEYMSLDEHKNLSDILKNRKNWLLSYDACKEVKDLYESFASILDLKTRYCINGSKDNWTDNSEFLIYPEQRTKFSIVSPGVGNRQSDVLLK